MTAFFSTADGVCDREPWAVPLAALSVSLEEQIGRLLSLLSTLSSDSRQFNALDNWLESARQSIANGNSS